MRILAEQSIPKIDEITARLTVVLREHPDGTYCTQLRNDDQNAYLHGHYRMSLPEAWKDFGSRVLGTWPSVGGVLVPPVAATNSKLVQPIEISLTRIEGPLDGVSVPVDKKITVKTYEEANQVIRRIARTAPEGGTYDKTDFSITFADGFVYEGRFDVVRGDVSRSGMLERHVREGLQFQTGEYRPAHTLEPRNKQTYLNLMKEYEKDGTAKEARDFLAEYDVGQGKP